MPYVVDLPLLIRLKRKIAKLRMHQGDVWEPVDVGPLLAEVTHYYTLLPPAIRAYMVRWRSRRHSYNDMALDVRLQEIEEAANRRYAIAHEWAHLFCQHRGDYFILWEDGAGPDNFSAFLDGAQEQQCAYVAAFILVRKEVLEAMKDLSAFDAAERLLVPPQLVGKRWEIWWKHHV